MKKLLIVDDSVELLDALQFFLEKNNYEVRTLSNTHLIIDNIKDFQPDLVILDVYISGKDGREICRSLRKNILTKYLCIMLFSASPEAIQNFEEHGADGCIEKPFNLQEIISNVEKVFNKCKDYRYN